MNFGYNSNVRVGNLTYHVQTEDRGPAHPFLDTVVYLSGRVVYKRSTSYEKIARGAVEKNLTQWLRDRLAQQHKEIIADLEAGKLPPQGGENRQQNVDAGAPAAASTPAQGGLTLHLKNPKTWLASGVVTLELEVTENSSNKPFSDADVEVCLEHERTRIPCADGTTDDSGRASLHFSMPANVAAGSYLVVRATDGERFGELRFRLKSKASENAPAPVGR